MGSQRHAPSALHPVKRPSTHCIKGGVGPRAGLDGCGNLAPTWTVQPVASRYTDRDNIKLEQSEVGLDSVG